ncbi:lecithin retinol acyltransferase [Kryptolebias marmoratus]|uniref:lecithin retinol acyltransferase n=1 Tax=Kryptolebias marmoratus TaxID=37003 RepID=UPI0007F89B2A|nr:lecithin retinol acyltransferase [Kryptolebias marmoratus]
MLDTLTFLLERLFLLAHIKLSSLLPPPARDTADPQPPPRFDSVRFQRGDLLEVPRTLFTHFGIYLGENRVAHLIPDILPVLTSDLQQIQQMVTNTRLLLGVLSKRASVRVDSVEDFAYGAVILQNAMDRAAARSPLAGEEVARRAEQLVGAVSYSLLWNNCEHFVTHCRYGSAQSLQTQQFCEGLKSLIRDQRVVVLAAVLGLLSMVCLGVSSSTALPSLLIPFTLWMAS